MKRPHLHMRVVVLVLAVLGASANAAFNLQHSSQKVAASKFFTVNGSQVSTFEPSNFTRPIATITSGTILAERIYSITDVKNISVAPDHFELSQNYPNPFNMSTKIVYSVPVQSNVSMTVYDMLGRRVAELVNGPVAAGTHSVNFEKNDIASGTYFYRLVASGRSGAMNVEMKKMILLK